MIFTPPKNTLINKWRQSFITVGEWGLMLTSQNKTRQRGEVDKYQEISILYSHLHINHVHLCKFDEFSQEFNAQGSGMYG